MISRTSVRGVICPDCDGKGWRWMMVQYAENEAEPEREMCELCRGYGDLEK